MRLSRLRAMMLEDTSTMHGLVIDAIFPAQSLMSMFVALILPYQTSSWVSNVIRDRFGFGTVRFCYQSFDDKKELPYCMPYLDRDQERVWRRYLGGFGQAWNKLDIYGHSHSFFL